MTHFQRMRPNEVPASKAEGVSVLLLSNARMDASQLKDVIGKFMQPKMLQVHTIVHAVLKSYPRNVYSSPFVASSFLPPYK